MPITMLKKILLVILLSATSFLSVQAQVLAELEVNFTEQKISNVPVSVSLDAITFLPGSELTLLEESSGSSIEVPYQIENKGERILHWLIVPRKAAQTRRFKLVNRPPGTSGEKVELVKQNGSLVIKDNQTKFLSYQFGMHYPPKGVDTAFKRSGFIHPLWTPNGQELTRINAPDHYHHYGLWNPWTKILFEGESLDFGT